MTVRLDQELVARGLVASRARARAAIEAGGVTVDGAPGTSPAQKVAEGAVLTVREAHDWVGRGALKLAHALEMWPVAVDGRVVLDVGASTGGFTEVCLRAGAATVYAVDVGRAQLHPVVSGDPRVVNLEGTDARDLSSQVIPRAPDLIVCDASFIGLAKVLPAALALAAPDADLVTLVKPQFEMDSRTEVGRKGVVRDAEARQAALDRVAAWLEGVGWTVRETAESPIVGGDGNHEWLLWARRA
ncbi:MAG: TlyA family RNA methyltransferase [Alphaproteobacteria bacterium]|nr:TlyA family RNA methyltransferase [Alphaproteobacteria bacterium]MBU1525690.1 TlyA family RNA methyltransferase [Alphaproteobacteria bacterium]MBU2116607.1 TlyA family RNA methyltransferase [Alphaproteobacteria bacterium]MBU2351929.1 TlyA family RNA methyltransferase [Alphaproteobacteria bacterium]MBU2383706.1 TlyA family RNA methyltransferase [Alphaproteobacteria bacterium]